MNGWTASVGMPWFPLASVPLLLGALAWLVLETVRAVLDLKVAQLLTCWIASLALLIAVMTQFQVLDEGGSTFVSIADAATFAEANTGVLVSLLLLGIAAAGAALFGRRLIAKPEKRVDPLQARRFAAVGALGEDRVASALERLGWPFLRNVVLARRGWSVEIDAIVCAPNEIVLLEVKTYSGVVSGEPTAARWEQRTWAGTRPIYSPLRQSEAHLAAVRTVLDGLPVRMCALIVSAGSARWEGALSKWVVPLGGLVEALRVGTKVQPWGGGRVETAWGILTTEAMGSEAQRAKHPDYVRSRRNVASGRWW